MKKVIITIVGIILLILVCFMVCNKEEINEKKLITEYVKTYETTLIETVNKIKTLEEIDKKSIIKKMPKGINISNIYKSDQNNYIKFSVDEGTSTRSHYYGFYYSPENEAKFIMGMPGEIYEFNNGYKKQESGNEDWYYTEKITDNFFYYEAHF